MHFTALYFITLEILQFGQFSVANEAAVTGTSPSANAVLVPPLHISPFERPAAV